MDFAEQELNFMLLLNGTIMARNSNARVVNGRTIYKRTQLDTWSDFECKHFLRFRIGIANKFKGRPLWIPQPES